MKKGLADLVKVAEHIGETFNEALGATHARARTHTHTHTHTHTQRERERERGLTVDAMGGHRRPSAAVV